jgi:hypothetical protein
VAVRTRHRAGGARPISSPRGWSRVGPDAGRSGGSADLAVAFLVTMALSIGVILVILTAEVLTVLH